jgi:hypothetical protein
MVVPFHFGLMQRLHEQRENQHQPGCTSDKSVIVGRSSVLECCLLLTPYAQNFLDHAPRYRFHSAEGFEGFDYRVFLCSVV